MALATFPSRKRDLKFFLDDLWLANPGRDLPLRILDVDIWRRWDGK